MQVDFLAEILGLHKVGWVFAQSNKECDYIVSGTELQQMAEMQDEIGRQCVTVLVTFDPNEAGGHVHFEVFQTSEQCVRMWKDGWLAPETEPKGVTRIVNPKEPSVKEAAIVAGRSHAAV